MSEKKIEQKQFDVAVIGGGPGGYVAAIKLGQLGKKVICIDDKDMLGGTCLNVGCIPSKALLNATQKYHDAQYNFQKYGIHINNVSFALDEMMEYKNKVMHDLGQGVRGLLKKNTVEYLKGRASFAPTQNLTDITHSLNDVKNLKQTEKAENHKTKSCYLLNVTLQDSKNKVEVEAKEIVIASGSKPITIPGLELDEKTILSSTGALNLEKVPQSMVIIGGGVIGLELGSVWSRLGCHVTIIEGSDDILPFADQDVRKEIRKIFEKQGIRFILKSIVQSVEKQGQELCVKYRSKTEDLSAENNSLDKINTNSNKTNNINNDHSLDNLEKILNCEKVLVSIGRKANTEELNLEAVGVAVNEKGQITVNHNLATNTKGIYAIGDVVPGPMLAHKASEEGIAVAEIIAGHKPYINYNAIPSVIYTHPEVAIIGKSENELKKETREYKIGKFPMLANSRSRTNGELEGFVKIIICKKTEEILGATIIATGAGEMIQELAVAIEFKATADDLNCISHAHPTVSEAIKEAATLAFLNKTIHI